MTPTIASQLLALISKLPPRLAAGIDATSRVQPEAEPRLDIEIPRAQQHIDRRLARRLQAPFAGNRPGGALDANVEVGRDRRRHVHAAGSRSPVLPDFDPLYVDIQEIGAHAPLAVVGLKRPHERAVERIEYVARVNGRHCPSPDRFGKAKLPSIDGPVEIKRSGEAPGAGRPRRGRLRGCRGRRCDGNRGGLGVARLHLVAYRDPLELLRIPDRQINHPCPQGRAAKRSGCVALTAITSATITVSRVAIPPGRSPGSARLRVAVSERLAGAPVPPPSELDRQRVVEIDGHRIADAELRKVADVRTGYDGEGDSPLAPPQRHLGAW